MIKKQRTTLLNAVCRFLRRKIYLLMIACMLGISNVILEEDRMVIDTRVRIEQQEIQPEDD